MFREWKTVGRTLGPSLLLAACGQAGPGPSTTSSTSSTSSQSVGGSTKAPSDAPVYDAAHNATLDDVLVSNKSAESTFHLLARIRFPASIFEFYEPLPGHIYMSEAFIAGAPMHQDAALKMDPVNYVELYKLLAPGTPVPEALMAAQGRFEQATKSLTHTVTVSSPRALPPEAYASAPSLLQTRDIQTDSLINCATPPANNGSCDPTWFNNNACQDSNIPSSHQGHSGGAWPWCLFNWWGGRDTWTNSTYDFGYTSVCTSIGTSILTMSMQYGNGGQWSIGQGSGRWAATGYQCGNWIGDWCNDQNHMEVQITATNSEFQHCGVWMDED